jgi:predicted nucleotidyltransferase
VKRIEAALRGIIEDLSQMGRAFALLGGFAVSARVEPRTTKDVDVAVVVDDDHDAEQVAFELSQRGYAVQTTIEHVGTGRLATIRTLSPRGAVVDILFASSGIEREVVAAATRVEILDGLSVPVATVAHLIAMKVLARDDRHRPQDRVDLAKLFACASSDDLDEARAALQLVTERGYARERELEADLARALAELRPLEQPRGPG